MMDFESSNKQPFNADEESLYVNYCPPGSNGPSRVPRLHSHEADEYSGDYAVMRPGAFSAKPATLPRVKQGGSSGLASPLANHLSSVGLNDTRQMCFMPIREKEERMPSPKPGDVPEKLTQGESQVSTKVEILNHVIQVKKHACLYLISQHKIGAFGSD